MNLQELTQAYDLLHQKYGNPSLDSIYKEYLSLFEQKMQIIQPKTIFLFSNQVSSIVLNEKFLFLKREKHDY